MKIAVTSQGTEKNSPLDTRFGRAKYIAVIETDDGQFSVHDNKMNLDAESGAGIQTAGNVASFGAQAVITGHVGPKAFRTLAAANIKVFLSKEGTVEEAVAAFAAGQLNETSGADAEGHWV